MGFAQHQSAVDFIEGSIVITPVPKQKKIIGSVAYTFKTLAAIDSLYLNAKNIVFTSVLLDGKDAVHTNNNKQITINKQFEKGTTHTLFLAYTCQPKQTVYFIGWEDKIVGNEQIWTQGQGKYTSHWVPSFDDMKEKVIFNLAITVPHKYTVIANGKLTETKDTIEREQQEWIFNMKQPMSSYLLAFAVGKYNKQEVQSRKGLLIENYFYPKDSALVEPTYRFTKKIVDFLEEEIGYPYPWQNYKQIPVQEFLYAGMENTGTTIFSDGYMIDSTGLVDKNFVNVAAHEMAHQWFGNLVTEESAAQHWLHEGFATYYAYLAEKEIFGNDYFYWKLFNTSKVLKAQDENGNGTALLDPKASSLTFYEKGAWALVILKEKIGEEAFNKAVKNYLKKNQFKTVTVSDFLSDIATVSSLKTSKFKEEWLAAKRFPWEIANEYLLEKSTSIREYIKIVSSKDQNWVSAPLSPFIKCQLIEDNKDQLKASEWENLLSDPSLKVRQAAIKNIDSLPKKSQKKAAQLLQDKSYMTQETALLKLWIAFPENRKKRLMQTKGVIGLPNKNVRLLWLTLALITQDFELENKEDYLQELQSYTKAVHNPEIRQNAFSFLKEIAAIDKEVLGNLLIATRHHSWQFKIFARRFLDELLQGQKHGAMIETLLEELNEDDLRYLKTKLEQK